MSAAGGPPTFPFHQLLSWSEKHLSIRMIIAKQLDSLKVAVAKQVGGASNTKRAEVAGVPAEARAAALEVLKDYGVAVSSCEASVATRATLASGH